VSGIGSQAFKTHNDTQEACPTFRIPMKLLELTLETAVENVAIDEALLETAEQNETYPELLRIWEPKSPIVVIGRSSPIETEVDLAFCESKQIDVVRRCSGGQSIVTGPGCLMYAVVLDYRKRPGLRMLDKAHEFVMQNMQVALQSLNVETEMQGTSDLTFEGRKFSGNALRCKRNWLVYHGTMLCDFDVELIAKCLGDPIRQPEYRKQRSHREFLTQLPVATDELSQAIIKQWAAVEPLESWPVEMTSALVKEKYLQRDWIFKV